MFGFIFCLLISDYNTSFIIIIIIILQISVFILDNLANLTFNMF